MFRILLSLCLMTMAACNSTEEEQPAPVAAPPLLDIAGQRSFRMGFSTFPYAATPAAITQTYAIIAQNADIYVEQFDEATVPWIAALTGAPFPARFQEQLDRATTNRLNDKPLVLVVMPLSEGRDGIAAPLNGQLPPQLQGKPIDDPSYVTAFANYTVRIAERLDPDYLITGLEVNDLYLNSPEIWPAYRRFNAALTQTLKQRFPSLPMSQSVTLHNFFSDGQGNAAHTTEVKTLLQEQDFTAVSYYPFLYGAYQDQAAYEAAFDLLDALTDKPIAFTETGNIAERLRVPSFGVDLPGSDAAQQGYLTSLLNRARRDDYLFVINWAHRDFDALTAILPTEVQELAKIWQDTGLWDENGNGRPALSVWNQYRSLPSP